MTGLLLDNFNNKVHCFFKENLQEDVQDVMNLKVTGTVKVLFVKSTFEVANVRNVKQIKSTN